METKECNGCGQILPTTLFNKKRKSYEYICKKCQSTRNKNKLIKESPKNFIGKKYPNEDSNITILQVTDKRTKDRKPMYLCLCKCGNTFHASNGNLKKGQVSCAKVNCPHSVYGINHAKSILIDDKAVGFFLTYGMFSSIKRAALKRDYQFNITPQDILNVWIKQNGLCEYTGLKLINGNSVNDTDRTWSVDRIDNTKGYEPDNILLCHKSTNMARGPYSIPAFITICHLVAKNYAHLGQTIDSMQEEKINALLNEAVKTITSQ